MPIPKDYRDIVNTLSGMTDDGRVNWRTETFGVTVSVDNSKFTIWAGTDERTEDPFVSFALMDAKGQTIDSWFVDFDDTDYQQMKRLHDAGKRLAMGIPQKLAQLRESIGNASFIGDPHTKE